MKTSIALKTLVGVAAMTLPLIASAESNYQTGAGGLSATAHVDFTITIPRTLYLRVGSGSTYPATLTSIGSVDLITFSPALATLGNNTPVAATGGDIGAGVETAAILTNSNAVSLTATATGALTDANGDTIPFTQINTVATALTGTDTLLTAPTLSNGVSAPVTLTAAANKTITADAKWTYTYQNAAVVPAGTYGGVNVHNGRVVYTATIL
jgi:hypothetical protein